MSSTLCHPLNVRRVMTELRLSVRQLAYSAQIGASALQCAITTDSWPKRECVVSIKARITAALKEAGASELQLVGLFDRYDPYAPRKERTRMRRLTEALATSPNPHIAHPNPTEEDAKEETMLLPKQCLTAEARKAFELFANPFDGEVTAAEEMFQTGEIRYVREACWQAAVNARFVAVVGESGAGKTTILGDLKDRILLDRKAVTVIEPSVLGMEDSDRKGKTLKSSDIQAAIAMTLDPMTPVPTTSERRTRHIQRLLEESTTNGSSHLLVIEEAHSLPIPTLQHLKRLWERMRLGRKPMMGILLLGHPELVTKLKRHDVREVAQRCEVVRLHPLDAALPAYVQFKAKLAGKAVESLITQDGMDELRTRLMVQGMGSKAAPISLLYPLAVNNFMTAALNVAAELGVPVINRDVVRAV